MRKKFKHTTKDFEIVSCFVHTYEKLEILNQPLLGGKRNTILKNYVFLQSFTKCYKESNRVKNIFVSINF